MTSVADRATGEMNVVISSVLRYGVVLSAILVLLGVSILFVHQPSGFPGSLSQLVSENDYRPTLSASQLFAGVAAANPIYLIELGLVVLLLTPVTRVAASVVMFALQRDRAYVLITLVVLTILLLSVFVIGPFEAAA